MNERPLSERPAAKPIASVEKPFADSRQLTWPVEKEKTPETPVKSERFTFRSAIVLSVIAALFLVFAIVLPTLGPDSGSIENEAVIDDWRVSYPIGPDCDAIMAASAADPSQTGEELLVESGNVCESRKEWEAALYRYPGAIGGSSTAYLDGSEYDLICSLNPDLRICREPGE